ncbi:ADP-ribosyl-[dinitrogen reductase] hydrolase [Niveibacterium sp.]|uniref:ADP-ribosyl-[dinitrogen reductase] hydrolase n=1 Tax=Niveibacterium sp. TaxID=2017444 RepID=UPI0035AE9816
MSGDGIPSPLDMPPMQCLWPAGAAAQLFRQHARGAMLGLALGDALGATVEFMTPREIRALYGCHAQIRGGGWLRLPPGQVTDDTTMAFAVAETLLASPDPAPADFARAFDAWMRSKPVDIGNTVRRGVMRFRRTGEACVPPSDDAGNGATMRCAPIAIALLGAPPETIRRIALSQARVTHHNPLTDAATLFVVGMIQAGILGHGIRGVIARAHALVKAYPSFHFRAKPQSNPTGYIVDTMRVVLQSIDITDSFESALIDVVNRGGDADTTGAITGAILGAMYGESALPLHWLSALRPDVATHCRRYADGLCERGLWPFAL